MPFRVGPVPGYRPRRPGCIEDGFASGRESVAMIQTNRIISGFDVELQLGAGWFFQAFRGLNEHGLLLPGGPPPPFPPDAVVTVETVTLDADSTNHDLEVGVTIGAVPLTVLVSLDLSDDGSKLVITSNIPDSEPISVPFDALSGLAGAPRLRKLSGNAEHDPCIAFLANLDLRASSQDQEPLPEGEHLPRGTELAVSFLPVGKDIAIGIGDATFPRIANDIWHDALRAEDGSHPFPDEDDDQGTWQSVSVVPREDDIRITLRAHVPVTGPDADVTITIDLEPQIVIEREMPPDPDDPDKMIHMVKFGFTVDSDVDTGILGSIFAFFAGGLLGFLAGLALGRNPFSALVGAGAGAIGGVVLVEFREAAQEGEIRRQVTASLDGEEVPPVYACSGGVVNEAMPGEDDGGLAGGFGDAIPKSIPVGSDQPDILHQRTVVVEALYDDFEVNAAGLAFVGMAGLGLRFQPRTVELVGRVRQNGELRSLVYRDPEATEAGEFEISLAEVLARRSEAETDLKTPFRVQKFPTGAGPHVPAGRIPCVCLTADAIRRRKTVVQEFHFSSGLDLTVAEAVALQDAGVIVLRGLQLIHPSNANPYFRAPANDEFGDNVERLPSF